MYTIGIDLGGTNIAAGIVDRQGNILTKIAVKTRPERPADEIIFDMADCCLQLSAKIGIKPEELSAVGIAAPGLVNSKDGIVLSSANLPLKDYPLAEKMRSVLGITTVIANDANCAALAELICGSGKGYENIIFMTIGTGIGGGLILRGKLYEGNMGLGGEIGHMVIQPDGLLCGCGRRGCSEMYISARALAHQARDAALKNPDSLMISLCEGVVENISARTPFIAARLGDRTAAEVVDSYISCLAQTILDYIYMLRPDIILIGGGMSGEGDGLFIPLREKVKELANASIYGIFLPPIEAATLKNDAGIIGAAALTWK